jgi:23S rRNA (guanosine2251-2'-O)-methyltransferase
VDRRARTEAPQGVVAFAAPVPQADLDDLFADPAAFLVALDGVTDPGNLGAIMRTAETAGATGIVVPTHRAVGLTPAVAKAAAGALEYLPVAFVSGVPGALDRAKRAGVWCVALDGDGDRPVFDLPFADERVMLVLGAEGRGVSQLARKRCDVVASIPMHGRIESLNVSAAAAVACTEIARRRSS